MSVAVTNNGGSPSLSYQVGAALGPIAASQTATNQSPLQKYTPLGLLVFFLVLYLINRSDTGHTAFVYILILVLVFLVVLNYQRILPKLVKGGA